jgi:hypothetical protein
LLTCVSPPPSQAVSFGICVPKSRMTEDRLG